MGRRIILLLVAALAFLRAPAAADAAGPWRARVVDAETAQPLEGVVVLAYWQWYQPSLGGWAGGGFHAAEEVVTGADGRFRIRSRWSYTIPLIVKVAGPEWVIFKPGYGAWRFQAPEDWKKFEDGREVVIELPPLKTKEQRLEFHDRLSWSHVIPRDKIPNLLKAWQMDRRFLGLER